MEYTCIGGTLAPELGSMLALEDILIHGNFISGTLPPEIDSLENLVQHKLGRNPISGTLPPMLKPKLKMQKYNCNFCALTGTFPDVFTPAKFPVLNQAYWDGNGFSGTLPGSIGSIPTMDTMSFNVRPRHDLDPRSFILAPGPSLNGWKGLKRFFYRFR